MSFSERLRQLSAARGLNQKSLAAEAHISVASINKWWNDDADEEFPSSERLARLARVFGVSMDFLFHGSESVLPAPALHDTSSDLEDAVVTVSQMKDQILSLERTLKRMKGKP